MTLDEFITAELADLEGFKRFYLKALEKFPENFSASQGRELWEEEFQAFRDCHLYNSVCLGCEPDDCHLILSRVKDDLTP